MASKKEQEKERRINEEIERINGLISEIDDKKKEAASSLVTNAAFMTVTLQDLQQEINKKGVTETYQNGANQKGVKKSSAVEVYNTMIKNHVQVIKQLTELLPKSELKQLEDPLEEFVMNK